ncbi:MAG TPA: autotransporter domain-containing protein [Casimicrobiaceae bacterium]|nr:autotransporter domain-containing protein [Casimicrobiaceae bacterium]
MLSRKTLLACSLAACFSIPHGEATAQFNQFYFFGDSLTDAGTYGARFTVNPGLVWAQDLGAKYGVVVTPWNQGGVDAAQGGAHVATPSPETPPGAPQRPFSVQVDQLLQATPHLNPNTLYSVWIGANDVLDLATQGAAGQLTPAQVQAGVVTAATQELQQIARLRDAGARYIVVFNLPDIGQTPGGKATSPAALTALSNLYNSTLQAGLASLNVNIVPVNIYGLLNEVIANPAAYGLVNVTTPACTTASAFNCTTGTLVAPNAAQTFFFADAIHPTPVGHQMIADVVAGEISAPQQMGLLANAPVQAEQANFRALDDRMWSNLNMPRAQSKFEAYAVYDYGNTDLAGSVGGGNTHASSVLVGGDMKISEQLLAGIAFGYTQDKASLGNSTGGFTLNDSTITFYVGYGAGPWYLGATVGGGSLDYNHINRSFAFGPTSRTENASTNGTQFIGRLLGGYWFNTGGDWLHGPYARLTWQDIKVDQFSETGTSATAMSFGEQKYDPFSTSLGWQAAGAIGTVRLFGRATWEWNNSSNDNRSVSAGVVSMPGTFSLPAYKFDNNYGLFLIGASMPLGGTITGFISGSFSAWNGSGNYQAVTVGIRAPI